MYVALFHYVGPLPFTNPFLTFFAHGYLAVDLFFILSGFVMAMNYGHMFETKWSLKSYCTFLGRRVARIYPLYLAATIVGLFQVIKHQPLTRFIGLEFVANVLMVQVWGLTNSLDGACWSLSAEWAAYLLFPLLLIPTLMSSTNMRWISVALCIGVLASLCFLPNSFHNLSKPEALFDLAYPNWAIPVVRCVAEFTLGLVAYRFAFSPLGMRMKTGDSFPVILICLLLLLMTIPRADLFVVMLFPLLVICLSSKTNRPSVILGSPPLEFVGLISYSIYLDHFLLRFGVRFYLNHLMLRHHVPHAHAVAIAVLFAITFPVSYAAYKLIEEPGRDQLRKLFEGIPRKTETIVAS